MRLRTARGDDLWLAYGMNVHPGGSARTALAAIRETVLPLRERLGAAGPFGLALRFDAAGVDALGADPALLAEMAAVLREHELRAFTGNAFVHGAFHGAHLKEAVYRPPWGDPERTRYTLAFAEVLAALNEPDAHCSLSTAPGAWRGDGAAPDEALRAAELATCARGLRDLYERTGVTVRLGLEPEPRCTLETCDEAMAFFGGPLASTGAGPWVGLCYDVCHQAVLHEDVNANLAALRRSGIPIVKVQASCALEVADPGAPAARSALARFDEPVYLHQVGAPDEHGVVRVAEDLPIALEDADGAWRDRRPWRIHFHMPVFRRAALPPLLTTRPALDDALRAVARGGVTEHLEIETYTWDVLPEAERSAGSGFDLVEALAREYASVLDVLREEGVRPVRPNRRSP